MRVPVLSGVRGATEATIVTSLGEPPGRFEVVRRCADLAELLAAAAAGLGTVAVVSADLPALDREAVNHLHGSGCWVVALADPRAPWQAERLRALGADRVIDDARPEQTVAAVVTGLLDEVDRTGAVPGRRVAEPGSGGAARRAPDSSSSGTHGPEAGEGIALEVPPDARQGATSTDAAPGGDAPSTVIAVWGPTGGPGRTTIAVNLAAELTALVGAGVLLVDADTYGGTVAQQLGLLDEAPGLAAAARLAATGTLDERGLAALTPVLQDGTRVLTGISRAERWPELPASSLEIVWQVARRLATWTVIDCGFNLEQDEVLSYDTRAPRRNAATLSALSEADVVVVVGSGDPIGLQRLVRALRDLQDAVAPGAARHVVVNRVRASASGPRPGAAITDALLRYAGVDDPHLVPEDRACDGAVLTARTLAEHAPSSAARTSIAALAARLGASSTQAATPVPVEVPLASR
ncbi:hypothetical protein [Actinotalea sp. K2]|uniref:AAA family ATPase n=1 Tax=Actinotalea sp. K2 TaxID=2939438 RepID=UPI002016B71B|nr:hypothetical protein [Actinotalea sp. K2]MCL3862658.1 hypothetical protein [Actinotalea sp. K2]